MNKTEEIKGIIKKYRLSKTMTVHQALTKIIGVAYREEESVLPGKELLKGGSNKNEN